MEEIKLKYQDIINKLEIECPFNNCFTDNLIAYRWIKPPIDNEDNFLPSIVLDVKYNRPSRRNSLDDFRLCSSCGLSMFISEEKAKIRFQWLPLRNQKLLGYTHIAVGNIENEDGLITKASPIGHFDLFEFDNIELGLKFNIISELTKW